MASYFFARKKKRQPVVADPKLWSTSSVDDDKPFHAEPKSESEKQQLVSALKDHYVFSALSTNDILQVIHRDHGNANLNAARHLHRRLRATSSSSWLRENVTSSSRAKSRCLQARSIVWGVSFALFLYSAAP